MGEGRKKHEPTKLWGGGGGGGSKQNRSKKCFIGGICSIQKLILKKQKVLSQQSDTQSEVEEICLHD